MQGGIDSPAQIILGWILQLGICWILSKQTYLAYLPCLTHYFSRNWQFPAFLSLTHPPAFAFSPVVLCVMKVLVIQYCPTLYHPMDCSPPCSSVHGILQAKILEWVAIPDSPANLQPRAWTQVSCIAGRFFTIWATIFPLLNMVKIIFSEAVISWSINFIDLNKSKNHRYILKYPLVPFSFYNGPCHYVANPALGKLLEVG